jgi:hypothetical protein
MVRVLRGRFQPFLPVLLSVLLQAAAVPTTTFPAAPIAALPSIQDSTAKVWVNTATGVYHCPNSRYYGATKAGEYLTELEARSKGYRPAKGRGCSLAAALQSTVKVWVNTSSGVYHCAGSRYYGQTKAGTFMAEGDALRAGHHPANGRTCATG